MNRRELLAAAASAGALGVAAAGEALAEPLGLGAAAREAYLYGLPLIEVANVRARMAKAAAADQGRGINRLLHNRETSRPNAHAVTAPNVDTLYSGGFLDLAAGPAILTLPPTGDRYLSVALMDMYTNNYCILGARATGPDGGRFRIVGPTAVAQPGDIRAPTPWTWMAIRLLVQGPDDMAAAHAVQDRMTLQAPAARAPRAFAQRNAPWDQYFAAVQELLAENPPPATDLGFFHRVSALGLGPQTGFDPRRFSASQAAEIDAGVKAAVDGLHHAHGAARLINGWTSQTASSGNFGQDYAKRAGTALSGLGALPPIEAMYMTAVPASGGRLYDGDAQYRLSFAKGGLPPVDAFWSLTMYGATPEMQFVLVPNPLDRYAIGDRTKGLKYNPDGSCDIWIGRQDPGDARRANWLPAPPSGPYAFSMRCYLPQPALLNGDYHLPAVVPV